MIGGAISAAMAGEGIVLAGAGAGAAAAALTVGNVIALGAAAILGLNILFAKIDMHGEPNSTMGNGTSEGIYDENGNLIYRRDYIGRPHFDKGSKQYIPTPHTHGYIWKFIKGGWHIIKKFILPF